MPPRQRAGASYYLKRRDVMGGARGDGGSGAAVEGRAEGSEGHSGLETEERVVVQARE